MTQALMEVGFVWNRTLGKYKLIKRLMEMVKRLHAWFTINQLVVLHCFTWERRIINVYLCQKQVNIYLVDTNLHMLLWATRDEPWIGALCLHYSFQFLPSNTVSDIQRYGRYRFDTAT